MSEDTFEAKYMHDGSRVLHRDKRVSRKMAVLLAIPALLMLAQAILVPLHNDASPRPMPPSLVPVWTIGMLLLSGALFFLAIAFGVLRFVLTERSLHVKYGLWGPTIPLRNVTSCKVVRYDWLSYGGWGIRRGIDGSWAYVPSNGDVVEVRYRDGDKEKKVLLGADDPHALAHSIQRATSATSGRVRIGATASAPAAEQAAALLEEAPLAQQGSTARARER